MGFYSSKNGYDASSSDSDVLTEAEQIELFEAFFFDENYSLSDEDKQALLESDEVALLEKAKYLGKTTKVRLSKNDDITRRTTMVELELAKKANSPIWKRLVKNRIEERKLLAQLHKQYGNKAKSIAMKSQRDYIKKSRNPEKIKVSDISHRD